MIAIVAVVEGDKDLVAVRDKPKVKRVQRVLVKVEDRRDRKDNRDHSNSGNRGQDLHKGRGPKDNKGLSQVREGPISHAATVRRERVAAIATAGAAIAGGHGQIAHKVVEMEVVLLPRLLRERVSRSRGDLQLERCAEPRSAGQ